MSLPTFLVSLLVAASVTSSLASTADFNPCCAFGGDGAAYVYGIGTITIPETVDNDAYSAQVPISVGASGVTPTPFVIVVVDPKTSPEDSLMGWYITQNMTAQTLYAWTNLTGNPQCFSGSVPLPDYYSPGFGLCTAGVEATLFQNLNFTYPLGAFSGSLSSQITAGPRSQISAYMSFSNDAACAPLALTAANNPFNTGAFSINILGGEPIAPQWTIPSYC